MSDLSNPDSPRRFANWPLGKIVSAGIIAGYLLLFFDLRFEHTDVVRHHWTAWIPIIFCGLMVVLGVFGVGMWRTRYGPLLLRFGFIVSLLIGLLGFWYHTHGHPFTAAAAVLSAWTVALRHTDAPPPLAPLAFLGLGGLGIVACDARFQPSDKR